MKLYDSTPGIPQRMKVALLLCCSVPAAGRTLSRSRTRQPHRWSTRRRWPGRHRLSSPLGGYSNRCDYLTRGTVTTAAAPTPSPGHLGRHQTRARAQVLWLFVGTRTRPIKADVIYAFDNLVREIEQSLSDSTVETSPAAWS